MQLRAKPFNRSVLSDSQDTRENVALSLFANVSAQTLNTLIKRLIFCLHESPACMMQELRADLMSFILWRFFPTLAPCWYRPPPPPPTTCCRNKQVLTTCMHVHTKPPRPPHRHTDTHTPTPAPPPASQQTLEASVGMSECLPSHTVLQIEP